MSEFKPNPAQKIILDQLHEIYRLQLEVANALDDTGHPEAWKLFTEIGTQREFVDVLAKEFEIPRLELLYVAFSYVPNELRGTIIEAIQLMGSDELSEEEITALRLRYNF